LDKSLQATLKDKNKQSLCKKYEGYSANFILADVKNTQCLGMANSYSIFGKIFIKNNKVIWYI